MVSDLLNLLFIYLLDDYLYRIITSDRLCIIQEEFVINVGPVGKSP